MRKSKYSMIYGYMFDCNEFIYNNKKITGLCCEIKLASEISQEELSCLAIKVMKQCGFVILVNCRGKNISVQPYKMYFLSTSGSIEDPIEIDHNTLMKYSEYIIDDINGSAESSWLLDDS